MEVPSSVFIPAGAVRSKLRQEQRLYDAQCALMLKELQERRRTLEQTRRRMRLELELLDGTRDTQGLQYTGIIPPDGTRDTVAYDMRVTRPRNRIPLRKVCTYRFNSIDDADQATPVVINARRTLVRLRNSASGRYRRAAVKPVSRSLSAPECASKPEVAVTTPPMLPIDRKQPPEVNNAQGKKEVLSQEPASTKVVEDPRAVQKGTSNTKGTIDHDINVDIAAIVRAQESLRDKTRVVRRLELERNLVAPRKPKPVVKNRTFVYEKRTSLKPKKLPSSTQTARRQPVRPRYRTPTPLPPPRQLTASGAFDYVDDVITQVSMGNLPPGESQPQQVHTQVALCHQQALSGAETTVQFELVPGEVKPNKQGTIVLSDKDRRRPDINTKALERPGTYTKDGHPISNEPSTKLEPVDIKQRDEMKREISNYVRDQTQSNEEPSRKNDCEEVDPKSSEEDVKTPGLKLQHPGAVSRKSSRVSFNEDVEVANYYNQGEEEVNFWTSEDDEDEEIMRLYSPPSEADSVDQVLRGSIHTSANSLMYGGTQRLKSHEPQPSTQVISNMQPATTIVYTSGFVPTGKRTVTAPKDAKSGRQAHPVPPSPRDSSRKAPVARKPAGRLVSERGPGTSRVLSTKPTTVRGTAKTLDTKMHQALANLDISGFDRGMTFTTTKPPSSGKMAGNNDLVKKPDINGLRLVPGGVRAHVRHPPSATEGRLRGRRPSVQLMQILDKRRESMSTADHLEVDLERQRQQKALS